MPTPTVANVCGALGATAIVNGSACSTAASAVVLINLRSADGFAIGACSGTLLTPRAILTAAHCIDDANALAHIWLGEGPQFVADSFTSHPDYRENNSSTPDVGVIFMGEDLPRAPIPLLTSRDARVGETAVIAGWGRDQNSVGATLRAGTTTISNVRNLFLETLYSASASAICAGDSGGPIMLSEGGVWSVAGVTSAASESVCTTGTNFYVNLRNQVVRSFVLAQVPQAGQR
jgi:hypothetical protein